ncbi:MAG: hypothetical protein JW934_08835 [Anaerolineae bacterium]|nr:hypothetical protein [Anaerolineae bacterium]
MKGLRDLLIIGFGILLIGIILFYVVLEPASGSVGTQAVTPAASGGGVGARSVVATPCAIRVGANVVVVYPGTVNVRVSPGYANKSDTDLLCGGAGSGEQFTAVDGPQVVDGLTWWKLSNARCTGWVAETTQRGMLILQDP